MHHEEGVINGNRMNCPKCGCFNKERYILCKECGIDLTNLTVFNLDFTEIFGLKETKISDKKVLNPKKTRIIKFTFSEGSGK